MLILGFSTVSCIYELISESGTRRDDAKLTKTTLIFLVGMEDDCINVFTSTFFSHGISSTAIFKQQEV